MFAKKSLVAVAAMLAAAGAAQAQSSLKVYGSIDLGIGSFEAAHEKGVASRVTGVESGRMMTSFIGFAGSEDLGGGLKAEFALESFIGADTGSTVKNNAGNFWGRASNVALSGDFGKVALGQYDNPLFTSAYTYNPFGSSYGYSPTMRHMYSFNGASGTPVLGFDTGWVNSVTYESPNFSGFSVVAQYAFKETNASTPDAANDKNSYAVAGTYAAGPFAATLTYVNAGPSHASGTYATSNTSSAALTGNFGNAAYVSKEKLTNLGASYDFGVVKAFGQYTYRKDNTGELTGDPKITDKIFQLGVSVPVTEKGSVLASFGQLKRKAAGSDESGKDEVFSVGYDYFLSKRTDVYGVFTNNRQTDLVSGQTFAVGIKHAF
jgi:predicted porin